MTLRAFHKHSRHNMTNGQKRREERLRTKLNRLRQKSRLRLSEDGDVAKMAWALGTVFVVASAVLWRLCE